MIARIPVQETNSESNDLPSPNQVRYSEVWFCGHCRFVESNGNVRKGPERSLGGFPIEEIAEFAKSCVTRGRKKTRLICCESAQQQRYNPQSVGKPPAGVERVLGNELLQTLTNPKLLDQFGTEIDARVSHLEGLIFAMGKLWGNEKKANQPAFDISGLWGAGDITNDNVPITSFLQAAGGLEALAKMDNQKLRQEKRDAQTQNFKDAHCNKNGLPDFFGYRIRENLLVQWQKDPSALSGRHVGRTGRQRARKTAAAGQQ
jgi:hypothetical protein